MGPDVEEAEFEHGEQSARSGADDQYVSLDEIGHGDLGRLQKWRFGPQTRDMAACAQSNTASAPRGCLKSRKGEER
jgi:hypothetical protein